MNQETKMNLKYQIQINDLVNTQENNNLVDLNNSELEAIHGGMIATQAPQYLGLVTHGFVDANGDPTALGDHFLDLLDSGALIPGSIAHAQALQVQTVELMFS